MADITIKAAVITVSDSRTVDDDVSGRCLVELLTAFGAEVIEHTLVTDDLEHLRNTIYNLVGKDGVNLIITTGGTGFGPRDNTPEATRGVIERQAPGIAEAIRRESAAKTPLAILSRGICGIRDKTLIINFPGSPRGVEECFEVVRPVLRHAINIISGETEHAK